MNDKITLSSGSGSFTKGDRRRPGRVEYVNPHLIMLLRDPAAKFAPDMPEGDFVSHVVPRVDADPTARDRGILTPIDGGCQVGSPHMIFPPDEEGSGAWPEASEFLTDQVCYVAGTRILTTKGIVAAEELTVGDEVRMLRSFRCVAWARHFILGPSSGLRPELAAPVLIRRHAITRELPNHDVRVAPSHCILVEDRVVPAQLLVNGRTIIQDCTQGTVRYCHIAFKEPVVFLELAIGSAAVSLIRGRLAERVLS